MSIDRMTQIGVIHISAHAIASLAGAAVMESYGVVGMASQKLLTDGMAELLKKENYTKGVEVKKSEAGFEVDLYVILAYGIKVSETVTSLQQKVKYILETSLEQTFSKINVYVQGVKVVK